jgi:tRNA-2-methylthio-N6-dimethylallyladenosine synthase
MNRKYTVDDYRRAIDRMRAVRPDIAFSSDFIVGFPGESDEDFKATLDLVREIGYAQAFSFNYSRRPGTPASAMPDQVGDKIKNVRLQELQSLLRMQQENFNRRMIGSDLPVLFENPGNDPGMLFGRTPYMQAARVSGSARLVGEELPVRIETAGFNVLTGSLALIDAA